MIWLSQIKGESDSDFGDEIDQSGYIDKVHITKDLKTEKSKK